MDNLVKAFQSALQVCLKDAKHGDKTTLAHTAGVHISTIYNLESGRRGTSEKNRRKIATALGYNYDKFIELGQNALNGIEKPPKIELLPMPDINEGIVPQPAIELIDQILFIAKYDIQKLNYIKPLTNTVYNEIRAAQDKKEEKLSA